MATGESRGNFVWYDLMTPDPKAAIDFYTRVLDWGIERWEGMEPGYTMWTAQGTAMGGIVPFPPGREEVPPHWMAYVAVPDVEATIRRAAELGGKVHFQPIDLPGVGRFSVLADPAGAAIAAYTPASEPAPVHASPRIGEFSWHELAAENVDDTFAFYSDLFGWEQQHRHDMGEMGPYLIFGRAGVPLGGIFAKPKSMPSCSWLCYVRVANLDSTVARVPAAGGSVTFPPHEVPGGDRIAICSDPQGTAFALHWSAHG